MIFGVSFSQTTVTAYSDFSKYIEANYNKWKDKAKRIFVEGLDSKAISYKYWDWVLEKLDLKPYEVFTSEELNKIKHPLTSCGGEGKEHKKLKEYISEHPEVLGYKNVMLVETEHILPSGDRLDVYIELSDGTHVAVEVKPKDAPDNDISRGIFQCIKYHLIHVAYIFTPFLIVSSTRLKRCALFA